MSAELDSSDGMATCNAREASEAAREAAAGTCDEAWRRRHVEELFRMHGDFLRRLAARLCRSAFDPDDLVQDVLERTVHWAHTLLPDHDHRAWMARVMRNLFIDQVRRRAAAPALSTLEEDTPPPPAEPRAWWEELTVEDLRARVDELPAELRRAFELFAFRGYSYAEIADRLGIPKMTVGTRLLRARRRLKQLLVARGGS